MAIEWPNRLHAMCLVSSNGQVQYADGFVADAFAHVAGSGVYTWALTEPVESILVPGPRAFTLSLSIADLGPAFPGIELDNGRDGTVRTLDLAGVAVDHAWSLQIFRGAAETPVIPL